MTAHTPGRSSPLDALRARGYSVIPGPRLIDGPERHPHQTVDMVILCGANTACHPVLVLTRYAAEPAPPWTPEAWEVFSRASESTREDVMLDALAGVEPAIGRTTAERLGRQLLTMRGAGWPSELAEQMAGSLERARDRGAVTPEEHGHLHRAWELLHPEASEEERNAGRALVDAMWPA